MKRLVAVFSGQVFGELNKIVDTQKVLMIFFPNNVNWTKQHIHQ